MQNPLMPFQGNLALNSVAPFFLFAWKKVHRLQAHTSVDSCVVNAGRARSITWNVWRFLLNEDGVSIDDA